MDGIHNTYDNIRITYVKSNHYIDNTTNHLRCYLCPVERNVKEVKWQITNSRRRIKEIDTRKSKGGNIKDITSYANSLSLFKKSIRKKGYIIDEIEVISKAHGKEQGLYRALVKNKR